MTNNQHYCELHQVRFFRNEKNINGENEQARFGAEPKTKVWYSHKKMDGTGFCVEKSTEVSYHQLPLIRRDGAKDNSNYMFICNAMNNAVALASNGKITVDQIGSHFQKILTELSKTA